MQKYINILSLSIGLIALTWCGLSTFNTEKEVTARYVRSSDLIYGYEGMKEAQTILASKQNQWKANLDTLRKDYSDAVHAAEGKEGEMSQTEEQQILGRQQNLRKYSAMLKERALDEEKDLLEGVLVQVNSFTETYAKAHGYDLIVGTTTDGSLLYGAPSLDITNELLEALNQNYRGQ